MADDIESSMQIVRKFVGANLTRSVFADACIDLLDEIERLRAELEEAYDACRYALADSPRWQENCATVIATWEARHD